MATIPEKIEVTVRTNQGENQAHPASDVAVAMSIADNLKTSESYMVCIVQDGIRIMRWDREPIVGENNWYVEDPDAFEVLGQLRSIVRAVRTVSERDLLGDEVHPAGLRCYQVGKVDWFAATSPAHALELMKELEGDEEEFEVILADDETLDEQWANEGEPDKDAGSLREWLAAATEPGWLAGIEE